MGDVNRSAFKWLARFGRDRFTLLIVVLAGLGTAHILVRTATYGAAVTTDSVIFLSTALNFLAGEGWRDLSGDPLTMWPPLFPLLLAAAGWVGIEPLAAGRWINAAAFGLIILAAGCWLRSNLRSQWLALAAAAIIAVSLPLSNWAAHFMTDFLFVLLTLLALIQLASFLNRRTDAPLWWATVFTTLAALTRYPGVALIGVGVLVLLPLARLRQTLVFGAVSSLPLLAVLAHNWAVTENLTRAAGHRRAPSGQSLSDGLNQIVEVFRAWVVPPKTPDGLAYLLWLAVAAVGLAGAAIVLRGRRHGPEGAIPFGAFTVGYIAFLVAVVPLTVGQIIDSRYLLPIYVPLLLAAVLLLDRFLSIEAASWVAAIRYVVASLVLLGTLVHVGFSARENLRRTTQAHVAGYRYWSYNTARWQHSETLNYIRDNPIEGRIYSNRRNLAWLADRAAAWDKLGKYRQIARKVGWAEIEAGARVVWFDRYYNRSWLGCDDLDFRVLPGMEIVAELADGVVFRRTAAEPFDAVRHRARKQRYVEQLIQQADERVVRAGWGVHRTGGTLIYHKEPCAPADVQAKFVLQVTPVNPADLPAHRKRHSFDSLGFYFDRRGFRLGDQCIAIAHLPTYAIDRIRVGQWISKDNRTLWEAELSASR